MSWMYRYWAFVTAAMVGPVLALLLLVPGSGDAAARLAWAHPLVYFVHQVEEHAWPGGFKNFLNRHVFKVMDRDLPLDDRAVSWINVPLTWVMFPLAALWLKEFPVLAAAVFA